MVDGPSEDSCETAASRHFFYAINTFVGKDVTELKRIAHDYTRPYRASVATVLLQAAGHLGIHEIVVPKRIRKELK